MNKRILIRVVGLQFVLYVILFIVAPTFFRINGDLESIVLFGVPVFITVVGMLLLSDKFIYWLISDFVLAILIFIYHPKGVYVLGEWGLFNESYYTAKVISLQVGILILMLILAQFGTRTITKMAKLAIRFIWNSKK